MSNRKNYNSLVFLTTLSVYLGLVLVGGSTPTVLAQAATTRGFDIKNEAVLEDDLDKKPDDEIFSELKTSPDQSNKQFIEQYAKTILALLERSYTPEINGYEIKMSVSGSFEDDEEFHSYFPALRKEHGFGDLNFTLDKDKLFGKFSLKSKFDRDISPAGNSYVSSLVFLRRNSQNKRETAILEKTLITFENNQVFIVTRLPRASIDALLAENSAQ